MVPRISKVPTLLFLTLIAVFVVAVACGGDDTTEMADATAMPAATAMPDAPAPTAMPDAPAPTAMPDAPPTPRATLSSFRPTATPEGGSAAPAATNTPVPTATPRPEPVGQIKVQRVIAAMPVLQETNRIWEALGPFFNSTFPSPIHCCGTTPRPEKPDPDWPRHGPSVMTSRNGISTFARASSSISETGSSPPPTWSGCTISSRRTIRFRP